MKEKDKIDVSADEARKIASEVFQKEYTAGLIVGLCIGAAFGIAIAVISGNGY